MTDQQANAVRLAGLNAAAAEQVGELLVLPWTPGMFITINPHGSTAVYPDSHREHVLRAQ